MMKMAMAMMVVPGLGRGFGNAPAEKKRCGKNS
jgi:hypothetical protein